MSLIFRGKECVKNNWKIEGTRRQNSFCFGGDLKVQFEVKKTVAKIQCYGKKSIENKILQEGVSQSQANSRIPFYMELPLYILNIR